MLRNRQVSLLVCLALCLVLLIGCAGPTAEPEGNGEEVASGYKRGDKVSFIIGSGGVGGGYYPLGGALASLWSSNIDNLIVTCQSTGGSVENAKLIENGEVEIALIQNDILEYAHNAKYMFDEEHKKMMVIGRLYPEIVQIFVQQKSNINDMSEMRGKRLAVGYAGSGANASAEQMLDVFGMTVKDIVPEYLSNVDSVDRMKDGMIDGVLTITNVPNGTFQEMCLSAKIKMISFTDEEVTRICEKYPFYFGYQIPAGCYEGQDEVINTVAVQAIVGCSADLDEELVYQLTKTMWEKQDILKGSLGSLADMGEDAALLGVTTEIHPGAIKYYKEIGVL